MCKPTNPILFPYNDKRATQAILWLLNKHGGEIDKLKLVKLLYYADKEHLLRYGRPIVGGQYYAMPHGPVSSPLLDDINSSVQEGLRPFVLKDKTVISQAGVDIDELSESDIEALSIVDRKYGHLSPLAIRNITHCLWEYVSYWSKRKGEARHPMPYEDLFKHVKDKSMLDIIREDQEVRSIF